MIIIMMILMLMMMVMITPIMMTTNMMLMLMTMIVVVGNDDGDEDGLSTRPIKTTVVDNRFHLRMPFPHPKHVVRRSTHDLMARKHRLAPPLLVGVPRCLAHIALATASGQGQPEYHMKL